MKTTGSIRCEIISGVVDEDLYQVSVKDERHMSVLFCVPKSAVTDIHEEVDWGKGTRMVGWKDGENPRVQGVMCFYHGQVQQGNITFYHGCQKRINCANDHCDISFHHAMLLTDWLKEHGNKENGDENC